MDKTHSLVTILVTFCFYLAVTEVPVEAREWSMWRNMTACNAKPCGCWGDKEPCQTGARIQMRFCKFDGISGCQLGGDLSMRQINCETHKCPGWSEFSATHGSECECTAGSTHGTRTTVRLCDNPPPVHPKVLCQTDRKQQAMREEKEEPCRCIKCCADYGHDDYKDIFPQPAPTTPHYRMETPSIDFGDHMDHFYDNGADRDDVNYGDDDYCVPCDEHGNPMDFMTPAGGIESTTASFGDSNYLEYGEKYDY